MSGWNSKAEVIETVKATITQGIDGTSLPRDPKCYNLAAIVRENFYHTDRYGWRTSTDAVQFTASLRRNIRSSARW